MLNTKHVLDGTKKARAHGTKLLAANDPKAKPVTKDERALAEKFGGKPFDLLPTLDAMPAEFDRRKP